MRISSFVSAPLCLLLTLGSGAAVAGPWSVGAFAASMAELRAARLEGFNQARLRLRQCDGPQSGANGCASAARGDSVSAQTPSNTRRPSGTQESSGAPQKFADSSADLREAMLARLNQARSRSRRCGDQRFEAAPALAWDGRLAVAAEGHSHDMADHKFLSHTGSDGLGVAERVNAAGYQWRAVAENIAAGQRSVEAVVDDWLASPGHCRNIMRGVYEEIGAARVDRTASDYGTYWTLVLGRPGRLSVDARAATAR